MKKQSVLLLGFIVIIIAFVLPTAIRYFVYNKAEGTVIQLAKGHFHTLSGDSTDFEFPIVAYKAEGVGNFTYAKGNEVLYSVPNVGDKVTVIYNPKDPEVAYLNKFGSFWFSLPQAMIFGLLYIVWFGIVNIIFVKSRKKKSDKVPDSTIK